LPAPFIKLSLIIEIIAVIAIAGVPIVVYIIIHVELKGCNIQKISISAEKFLFWFSWHIRVSENVHVFESTLTLDLNREKQLPSRVVNLVFGE